MTIVLYHSGDFDGIMCREIAKKYLGEDAQYIGYEYGEAVPEVGSDEDVYMLDISIPELMERKRLIWIDHHKTAIEKYKDIRPLHGVRIDGVAACRLAWQYFHGGSAFPAKKKFIDREVIEPVAVRLAGEYDIWDKRDPRAELFQHGLRSMDLTNMWGYLLSPGDKNPSVSLLLQRAEAIEYYVKSQNAEIINANGFDLDFEGRKFLSLNTARYNSLNFEAGLKPEHDGCLGFKWVGDKWSVSMYGVPGKPDIDFSEIAKKWGGGGHKQACGFTAKTLPWLEGEMTDKPIISGAGIELRSLVHVSDREFCQSRNGEMMMTVEGFHRMTDLHEVLNDLSSRLRELEATCARQQGEIEGLKPKTYLQGEGYEVMGEVSVTFNRAEQEILKKLLFAPYRDVQEIQKGNMIFRARFIHKFDDDELKEFGAKIDEILR